MKQVDFTRPGVWQELFPKALALMAHLSKPLLTTIDSAREHLGHEHQHHELCSARGHAQLR